LTLSAVAPMLIASCRRRAKMGDRHGVDGQSAGSYRAASLIFYQQVEQCIPMNYEQRLSEVYAAIADPTRRAILAALADSEMSVGGLAERFPMTFNGVSKHVKVLERAGLVARNIRGREHRLRVRPMPLREAEQWLKHYRAFWEERLTSLESLLVSETPRIAGPKAKRRTRVS
jgi:DNA-binding transcriptional ArsR family regulator